LKRDPTPEEHAKIADAIFANDRVEAVGIYISITERGLTEAQDFINRLKAELTASSPEKFARRKALKRSWLPARIR
jgi:hypothetical protein